MPAGGVMSGARFLLRNQSRSPGGGEDATGERPATVRPLLYRCYLPDATPSSFAVATDSSAPKLIAAVMSTTLTCAPTVNP